ncbi:MAG TPA: thiamine phosphate synthase [Muricauda sp.]|uniref:Thiamine-phosphate synthase n=1 Tax=Flagellimonas abyssi TaxID=2864871 RepID=A0ABS7ER17_9FLAO|nr:thiamine phosphate synthase [Allomuricauda abyssi]MBC73264.1 thiamine phosphate synthase [Allomuricauda sp.]MBW8200031.1 thiamine phosphate synthase [Allomuricauda abyssi]HBU79949.1 thiamine phosphate synthase [Allomuricauda sp.]
MKAHSLFPYRLYLVISEDACRGKDMLQVAEQAIQGGVDIIQLREKQLTEPLFLERAKQLRDITEKYGVPLIINDNPRVAALAGASGIHVGNTDTRPTVLRQRAGFEEKLIGYSIEYLKQLENVQTTVSDYLAISPVFSTNTKTDTVTEWGLEGISKIRQLTTKPLVAIGNIHVNNTKAVFRAGADCIAVVSAICGADDPMKAAYQLKNTIEK